MTENKDELTNEVAPEGRVLIDPLVASFISANAANLQRTNERIDEWNQKKIDKLTKERDQLESNIYFVQEAQRMLVNPLYAKAFVLFLRTLPYDEREDDEYGALRK